MHQTGVAYLAAEGYESLLEQELQGIVRKCGRLFLTDRTKQQAYWAQNVWLDPFLAPFDSISEAATLLKKIQRNWVLDSFVEHRRAALIQEQLPRIAKRTFEFPAHPLRGPLGSWTLLDRHTLLASPHCSSLFPHGEILFQECREGPPSRAYLKLWEALTVLGKAPGPGSRCLEIGASPGGWTWVLAQLGAQVECIDRSPLAPEVAAFSNVHFRTGNAFTMTPDVVGEVDWIFSDVACYPEKLLEWLKVWVASGKCKQYVCTLKFQGETSYSIAGEFVRLLGGNVVHLGYNKHELTWICS